MVKVKCHPLSISMPSWNELLNLDVVNKFPQVYDFRIKSMAYLKNILILEDFEISTIC